MTVTLHAPDLTDLRYITANLRLDDHAELFALRWDDDTDAYAEHVARLPDELIFLVKVNSVPAAVFGAVPVWPGVWNVFAFGTDKWDKCVVTLTKHARRFLIPAVHNSGFHRAQAWSAATHTKAHAWMQRSLGARLESHHPGFGRGGEDFHLFVWDRQDTEQMMRGGHVR